MASASLQGFWRDESGASILEFTVTVTVFFLAVFGIVEFGNLFYQWNAASKATQYGARLAAVSEPIASNLTSLTGLSATVLPGDPMPDFDFTCTSSNATGSSGTCTGTGGTYSAPAMQTLVYGRGNGTTCPNPTTVGTDRIGMCNLFNRITPLNISVRYLGTGLGYAGRPPGPGHTGAPVPTIIVQLRGDQTGKLTFQYIMLNGLVPGLTNVAIPPLAATSTGEDLNSSGI